MKREGDHSIGWLAWTMHFFVLSVAIGGGAWTMLGVRDLRDASERRSAELDEFRRLSNMAGRAAAHDLDALSRQIGRRIASQTWYDQLDGIRPRVVRTAAGLRVRFTVAVDASQTDRRPAEQSPDGGSDR